MKLFAATVAASAMAQGFKRSSAQIEESFVIVPEGYGGSFEGFNATQVVLENAEDDLFREFEDEFYAVDVDVMSRSQFTEEEKKMIRKFKLIKNMIVYLQQIKLFGKFCFYGCYCFAKGPRNLLVPGGNSAPMDGADSACKRHLQCNECSKMDFGETCSATDPYNFVAKQDDVTGIAWIQCIDEEGSCGRALCECDKALAYDLSDAEREWNILHHAKWGNFDLDMNCVRVGGGGTERGERFNEPSAPECCGQYPRRYPYRADDGYGNIKQCCVSDTGYGKSYNPMRLECCASGSLKGIGSCDE